MGSPILWGPNSTANNLQQNLGFNNGAGPSILTGTVDPSSVATAANEGSLYLNTSNAKTYQKQDNGSTTNWTPLSAGSNAPIYSQAFVPNADAADWTVTSTSAYADFTLSSGSSTITVRQSSGLTLTAAGSNLPGITFTPPASAVYYVSVVGSMSISQSKDFSIQLTDGTTVIGGGPAMQTVSTAGTTFVPFTLEGYYVPGVTTPVTVKIQGVVSSGTGGLVAPDSFAPTLEWSIQQIAAPASGGSGFTSAQAAALVTYRVF